MWVNTYKVIELITPRQSDPFTRIKKTRNHESFRNYTPYRPPIRVGERRRTHDRKTAFLRVATANFYQTRNFLDSPLASH